MDKTSNKFINDNFAIVLSGSNNKLECDVHINDWVVYPFGSYIDFGFRIYNIIDVTTLEIYVPYKIGKEDIQDLAPLFGDEKVSRGMTNTIAKIITSTTNPSIDIEYYGITETIYFLSLIDYSICNCENGTIISFSFDRLSSHIRNDNGYIRFRIPHKSLDEIFKYKKHDYKFTFESPIITDYYYHTIRINEFRSLPLEVRHMLSTKKQTKSIKKVCFYLSANEKINIDDNYCENVRPLENDLFGTYIPKTFKDSNTLSYQWIKRSNKYVTINFKCSTNRIQLLSLFIYSFLVIFLSIIGNVIWEVVKIVLCFD